MAMHLKLLKRLAAQWHKGRLSPETVRVMRILPRLRIEEVQQGQVVRSGQASCGQTVVHEDRLPRLAL